MFERTDRAVALPANRPGLDWSPRLGRYRRPRPRLLHTEARTLAAVLFLVVGVGLALFVGLA